MTHLNNIYTPSGDPVASVIFVHGLGGHYRKTWQSSDDNEAFWPMWLASDLKNAAVYSLAYDAPVSRLRGLTMHPTDRALNIFEYISAHPKLLTRPIVFIAHSLGGLIVKHIIRIADVQKSTRIEAAAFLQHLTQIIFLATPHLGSGLATYGDRLRLLLRPSSSTVSLVRNDPNLKELNTWFRHWCQTQSISLIALAETQRTRFLGAIVKPDSSDPGIQGCRVIPVDYDHSSICKPRSREADVYRIVLDAIVQLLKAWSPIRLFDTRISAFRRDYLPSNENRVPFGGRQNELEFLNAWLSDPDAPARLLITSPAGRGKSALLVTWTENILNRIASDPGWSPWRLVFVPISMRHNTNIPAVFYRALATQLAAAAGRVLAPPVADPEIYYVDQCHAFAKDLIRGNRHTLIVIDGIDEALYGTFASEIFPNVLGQTTRLILSARLLVGDTGPDGWKDRLNWSGNLKVAELNLDRLNEEAVYDVLRSSVTPERINDDVARRLYALTQGEGLLLRLYIEELWNSQGQTTRIQAGDLDRLEPGFTPFFRKWLELQRRAWQTAGEQVDAEAIDAIFAVLACASGPITADGLSWLIHSALGLPVKLSITRIVSPLSRFVLGTGNDVHGYVLGHPKFGEFLRAEYFTKEALKRTYLGYAAWGKTVVSELRRGKIPPAEVPPYLVFNYARHLDEVDAGVAEFMELVDNTWRLAWEHHEGGLKGFSEDLRLVLHKLGPTRLTRSDIACATASRILVALCLSSIRTIGTNIPAELLALAVADRVLTPTQALNYIDLQAQENRATYYAAVAEHLTLDSFHDALEAVNRSQDQANRAQLLVQLCRKAPTNLGEALLASCLVEVHNVQDVTSRANLMIELLPNVKGSKKLQMTKQVQELLNSVQAPDTRASLLSKLILEIESPLDKASATELMLAAIRDISDVLQRARAILSCRSLIPPDWLKRELVSVLQGTEAILADSLAECHSNPTGFERHYKSSSVAEIYAALRLIKANLSPGEGGGFGLNDILSLAGRLDDIYHRANMLVGLVPYGPQEWRSHFVHEVFQSLSLLASGNNRTHAMMRLASVLQRDERAEIVREGLRNATLIEDTYSRARALVHLLGALPTQPEASELNVLFKLVQTIPYVLHRGEVLLLLSSTFPWLGRDELCKAGIQLINMVANRRFGRSALIQALQSIPAAMRTQVFNEVWEGFSTARPFWIDLMFLARNSGDLWREDHFNYAFQHAWDLARIMREG